MNPRRFATFVAALFLSFSLVLGGCSSIQLIPAYDEQIDSQLTSLYADTSEFVDRMIAIHGTPDGEYAANRDFYDKSDSRMEALIARAEAHRVLTDCPTARVVSAAIAKARIPADIRGQIGTLPKDDCQVVMMRLIKDGFETMRRFHEAQGHLGIPPSARGPLLDGGVGGLLRAGITVEIAKRAH